VTLETETGRLPSARDRRGIDLGAWAAGEYRVPAVEEPSDQEPGGPG